MGDCAALRSPRQRISILKEWALPSPLPSARFWSHWVITPLYPALSLFAVAVAVFPRQNRVLADGPRNEPRLCPGFYRRRLAGGAPTNQRRRTGMSDPHRSKGVGQECP